MRIRTSQVLQILMAVLVAVTLALYADLAFRPFFSDENGAVVVITTMEQPTSYGDEVWNGAWNAAKVLKEQPGRHPPLDRLYLGIGDSIQPGDAPVTDDTRSLIRLRVLERLARGKVLGFISTGSSSVDKEIARILSILRVPLIITGATSTDVLPARDKTNVVRLIGNNEDEADAMVAWIQAKGKRAAVLYQPSAYGTDLATRVAQKAGSGEGVANVLPFPIASPSALADLRNLQAAYKLESFVIIAYPPTLNELVAAVSMMDPAFPMLLSDSAAGAINRKGAAISFCVPLVRDLKQEHLGSDAYLLLANLDTGGGRQSFVERLNNVLVNDGGAIKTNIRFTDQGERQVNPGDPKGALFPVYVTSR